MKRYSVTFTGRLVGALGITYSHHKIVEIADGVDDSHDAIVAKLYDTHEHIHNVRIVPVEIAGEAKS